MRCCSLVQANKTGNYSVLRDPGSPNFQAKSAAQLGDIFASQRKQALDFSAVAVFEPQLTLLPQIEPNGMLHEAVNRQWKIYGMSVYLTSGGPQAPDTPFAALPKPADAGWPPESPSIVVQPKKATMP